MTSKLAALKSNLVNIQLAIAREEKRENTVEIRDLRSALGQVVGDMQWAEKQLKITRDERSADYNVIEDLRWKLECANKRATEANDCVTRYIKFVPTSEFIKSDLERNYFFIACAEQRHIDAIKTLRTCSGLGLKEAKDLYESKFRVTHEAMYSADRGEVLAPVKAVC